MVVSLPDSWSNWNLEMLVFEERGKPEYPEKNLSEQEREPTTNSTHIWRGRRDLNPGHIGGRRVLSPLHHPCSPGATFAPRKNLISTTKVWQKSSQAGRKMEKGRFKISCSFVDEIFTRAKTQTVSQLRRLAVMITDSPSLVWLLRKHSRP